jgi:hypothetical protein
MAYSQGGLIAASDYNNFLTGSNQLNTIWSTGTGNAGYGQTALATVSQNGSVTAAQWATLVGTLNSTLTHQSGSGSGISSSITSGQQINYLSTLSTNINTAYTNRTNFNTQGTTTTGSVFSPNFTAVNTTAAQTFTATRTATFSSADAARYFFNCGGQLNFVCGTATNGGSTNRGGDLVTLVNTNFISVLNFRSGSNGTRTGTGGTATSTYASGYYGLTTSAQTIVKITSATSPYTGDYIQLTAQSNGVQGANADKGTVITFVLTLYSDTQSTYASPPAWGGVGTAPTVNTTTEDSINITVPHRVDVVYPETTNLTSSWGTVTIA